MNEKINENELYKVLSNIQDLKDLKHEDLGKFLQSQGYNWTNLVGNNIYGHSSFSTCDTYFFQKAKNDFFYRYNYIAIYTKNSTEEQFITKYNEFVKHIYFEVDKFFVYTFIQKDLCSRNLTKILEKDLSKEWVQFLAKNKKFYHEGLLRLCIQKRTHILKELEETKKRIEIEKNKLDKQLEEKIISTNKEIDLVNATTECLEEINN